MPLLLYPTVLQFSKAAESTPSLRRQTIELQQPPVLLNPVNQTKTPEYPTYDEALEATGMFVGSGAVAAGESGESEQYTQPFQLLSWYPRYACSGSCISHAQQHDCCDNT